jgi:hypothetical protein
MMIDSLFVLCCFVSVDEELYGGGVYCKGIGTEELKMSECSFLNVCSSLSGGGIFVFNFSFIEIINSLFENVLSGESCGAMFISEFQMNERRKKKKGRRKMKKEKMKRKKRGQKKMGRMKKMKDEEE